MEWIDFFKGFVIGLVVVFILLVLGSPTGYVPDKTVGDFVCNLYGYDEFKKINTEENTILPPIKSIECFTGIATVQEKEQ